MTDCVFVPCAIEVVIMGVASPEMRARSCVLGSVPTLGFNIAKHVNKYQVPNNHCVHEVTRSLYVGHPSD